MECDRHAKSLTEMCIDLGWDIRTQYVPDGPGKVEDAWWAMRVYEVEGHAQKLEDIKEVMDSQLPLNLPEVGS